MNILGVAGGYPGLGALGHDPAACIIKDGKIIAAVEEERFVRVKHAVGYFPVNSIKYCLNLSDIKIKDIDYIGFYYNPSVGKKAALKLKKIFTSPFESVKEYYYWHMAKEKILDNFKNHFKDINLNKIRFMEHHLTHAASSYRVSGFKKAAIMTIDFVGEDATVFLGAGRDGEIEKINEITMPNTIGGVYTAITEYLGFKPNNDEYKVMGLASYGSPIYPLNDVISLNKKKPYFQISKNFRPPKTMSDAGFYSDELVKKYGPARKYGAEITKRHEDMAASLQEKTEEVALHMLSYLYEVTGYDNLCLAGGVALNVTMNSVLLRSPFVKNIFIQPAANDAGCAMGAALELYHEMTGETQFEMPNAYLGPEYSDEEIVKALNQAKIEYEQRDDISQYSAELLEKQYILAWFQGRLEWGPRALGNRSILADPHDPDMKDKINYYVKGREPWRPFAPSLFAEKAYEYFEYAYPSPYMLLSFKVKEEKLNEIISATHVDKTARPQTVEATINPKYYNLIDEFYKITGIPVVLNTSFNIRGEPIVNSPRDALRTFFCTGLDYLIIGNYIIKKRI